MWVAGLWVGLGEDVAIALHFYYMVYRAIYGMGWGGFGIGHGYGIVNIEHSVGFYQKNRKKQTSLWPLAP